MEELPADPAEGIAQQAPATRLFRRVYTVGFSQPADTVARKRPQDYSKEGFAVLLQERHADVFAAQAADGVPVNTVVKVMVFAERHADGNLHYYAVVQCARPYGCARLQKRLQTVDRVYTSFGTAHTYFWSAVVYASVPTPHKSPQEMDPNRTIPKVVPCGKSSPMCRAEPDHRTGSEFLPSWASRRGRRSPSRC
jgi:hypothetical protein